jgi:hypothetical protein
MNIFSKTFNTYHLSIFFISDAHEGNINHNKDKFNYAINYIKKTVKDRDVSVIDLGDPCDAILHTDKKRFDPDTIDPSYSIKDLDDLPRIQADKYIEKINPIISNYDILLRSNHSNSIRKYHQFDIDKYISDNTKSFLMDYEGIYSITLNPHGNASYKILIALTHGCGGGGFKAGYSTSNVVDYFENKYIVDIGIMAHTHRLLTYQTKYFSVDNKNNLKENIVWYGNSGCFLETYIEGNDNYNHSKSPVSQTGFLELQIDCIKINDKEIIQKKLISHPL